MTMKLIVDLLFVGNWGRIWRWRCISQCRTFFLGHS